MICSINYLGKYDCGENSYFFAHGYIPGWATWKRVFDTFDDNVNVIKDKYISIFLFNENKNSYIKESIKMLNENPDNVSFTKRMGLYQLLNDAVAIFPKVNMQCNIGNVEGNTHGANEKKLMSRGYRRFFELKK